MLQELNGNLYFGDFLNNKKHGQAPSTGSLSSHNPKADQFVEYYDGEWWADCPTARSSEREKMH